MFNCKRIAILIGSVPKPRTFKRIRVFSSFSNTRLICWNRMNDSQLPFDTIGNMDVVAINVKAKNDPLKRIIPYLKVKKRFISELKAYKPEIIHVEGLDILNIAQKYKNKYDKNVRIIYEVPDLRRLITEPQKGIIKRVAKKYVCNLEKKLCYKADLIIITSMKFYDMHYCNFIDKSKFIYIPNVPDLSVFKEYKPKNHNDTFTIGWIGSIRYKNQMKNLISLSEKCRINLFIAGYEDDTNEIHNICVNKKNITWFGPYSYERDIVGLYEKCDAIFAVYNANLINERIALPNKLYESVICGLPIIVSKGTYLSEIVNDLKIGVSVDCDNVDELEEAIHLIKTNYEFYQKNCSKEKERFDLSEYNNSLIEKIEEWF